MEQSLELLDKWEHITLANNFVFGKFMQNEELCKKVLSEILGREVARIEEPQVEKTLKVTLDSRGIRLDVYFRDDIEHVYNIEMQNRNYHDLEKRGRYYNSVMDVDMLKSGVMFDKLNDTYIIFICTFDYFGEGLSVYTIKNTVLENPSVEYKDGVTHMIINTKGKRDGLSDDLCAFLDAVKLA